jgi:hypothetical protein
MLSKKEIRDLISQGQLPEAAQAALEFAEKTDDTETLNGLLALNNQLNEQKANWLSGQIAYETFSREQARITHALLARLDALPNAPLKKGVPRMPEIQFKWRLFYGFILAKMLVFGAWWLIWTWGMGFSKDQAMAVFNTLIAGFVLYSAVMYRELYRASLDAYAPVRYVASSFQRLLWFLFSGYVLIQVLLMIQGASAKFDFTVMNMLLILVETGLGRYMAEFMDGVFRRKEE